MKFDLLAIFTIFNLANYKINSIDAVKIDEINSKMPNKIMDFQNYWQPRDSNVCEDLKQCYSDYDCGKNYNLPYARCIRDPGYIKLLGTLRFYLNTPSSLAPAYFSGVIFTCTHF